jgi:NAD(P)-dependent dehydrogenase (short-subunit alcohol dehydrogenase family)
MEILVNNACVCAFGSFENTGVQQFLREFDVNVFGCVRMIHTVLPYMKALGRGIIHYVRSGVGINGFAGICGYASSKGAIDALTRTGSMEFR